MDTSQKGRSIQTMHPLPVGPDFKADHPVAVLVEGRWFVFLFAPAGGACHRLGMPIILSVGFSLAS